MGMQIELREVRETDMDLLFEFNLDPEANRMAAFTRQDPSDRAGFDAHIAKILADQSVVMKTVTADGAVVGSIGKFVMFNMPQVTYWIGREHWGKGIATAALKVLLADYPERPIYGMLASDNLGSASVLSKCGFVKIGSDRGFANARGEEIEEHIYRLD